MRVAPRVVLSPEERSRLLRWRGGRGAHRERARRARLILLAAEGHQNRAIARQLGLNRMTVARWRRRFLRARLRGLEDTARLAPSRIPAERLDAIVRASVALRPGGAGPWTTRGLARAYRVSHMTVRRLWQTYGIRPSRFEAFPPKPDPLGRATAGDVVGVWLDPPGAILALTLVTASPSGPGSNVSGPSSSPPILSRDSAGLRRAAIEPALPRLVAPARGTGDKISNPSDVLRFLDRLERRASPQLPLRAVVCAPRAGSELERWRVRRPRVTLEFAPDFATWQRRALEELRAVGLGAFPRGQLHGRAEVARSLAQFVRSYTADRGPFEWLASSREIEAGAAAYRLRYDLAVTGVPEFMRPHAVPDARMADAGSDEKRREMARTILRRYLRVTKGERITIESWSSTLAEANALVLESLRVGARPLLLYQDEPTYWAAASEVPAAHLAHLGEHRRAALERTDVFVSFFGPSDRERFHSLPPAIMFRLGEYQDALYRAAARSGARAVQMALGRVSAQSARMYGVEESAWRSELVEGCLVDPAELRASARRVAARLATGRTLEIRHVNGTRLTLRLLRRQPVVSDGRVGRASDGDGWSLTTLPAGVVSAAVDERYAEGLFRSNHPSSVGLSDTVGELVGGRWTFRGGRLSGYRYEGGEEFFRQSYDRAGEGKDRPASVSIGLNPRLDRAPLLEDQGLGTVTLHIGRNDYLGGRTATPWWAWLFLRGANLAVDGKLLLDRGSIAA